MESMMFFFFFNDTATTEIYTLSLHDALPIYLPPAGSSRRTTTVVTSSMTESCRESAAIRSTRSCASLRSEEHTSELQSRQYLVCRLLLEKKKLPPWFQLLPSFSTMHETVSIT